MAVILANNANGNLAASITAAATTFTLQAGQGERFPAPPPGDWFPLTLVRNTGEIEVCKCTARSGDIFTVERGQEGTTAKTFDPGSRVSLRITNAVFTEIFGVTHHAAILALAALTAEADKIPYFTGDDTAALATLTAFAMSLLDDADASAARTTLGLGSAAVRAALGSNELYSRDSIIGAVSEASGIPTGAIIEQGSNANGYYLRFADGTQLCFKVHNFPASSNNNAGTLINYPVSFASVYSVHGSAATIISATTASQIVVEARSSSNTAMLAKALQHTATTVADPSIGVSAALMAVGRWY